VNAIQQQKFYGDNTKRTEMCHCDVLWWSGKDKH